MNIYDSDQMTALMRPLGYSKTDHVAEADLVVLNTCHIREKADDKVFSDIGRLEKQMKKTCLLAVAGCTAQSQGLTLQKNKPRIDIVIGTQNYHRLPDLVARRLSLRQRVNDTDFPIESKFDYLPQELADSPAPISAFITVQEGCDKFCSFCVVPYTRGAEYSRPYAAIAREAAHLVSRGTREVTLLGQNVNAWHGAGPDGRPWNLARLIAELSNIDKLLRIRYITSHLADMNDALIAEHGRNPKLQPFLHLPLQSGSDKILKAMNRGHTLSDYRRCIDKIRNAQPEMVLSSDFIVGFPEEEEEDFMATLQAVESIGYAASYSFAYSPRPGTPAANRRQVTPDIKSRRLQQLQSLLNQQEEMGNQRLVGKTIPVLLEKIADSKFGQENQLVGRSPWLQPVHIMPNNQREATAPMLGQMVQVYINRTAKHSLFGTI